MEVELKLANKDKAVAQGRLKDVVAERDTLKRKASILGYKRDLSFCYITCAAVVGIVYWPSNPRHEIIYTYIYYRQLASNMRRRTKSPKVQARTKSSFVCASK